MKKLWLGILATMLVVVFVAPAFAWEYSMTGQFEWRQQYLSRMGNNDIFGNTSLQDTGILPPTIGMVNWNSTTTAVAGAAVLVPTATIPMPNFIGFAGPSIYTIANANVGTPAQTVRDVGNTANANTPAISIIRGGFSTYGDAAWIADLRFTMRPEIRVNNAIRIGALYTVGGMRNKFLQNGVSGTNFYGAGIPPYERYSVLSEQTSAFNTVGIGSFEQLRATIQLPWGTFAIGHRDFPFGTGMVFAQNTPTSSTLLVVPYGPFRLFGVAMLGEQITLGWDAVPDVERKLNWRIGAGLAYDNGPLSVGTMWLPQTAHVRRALNFAGAGNAGAFAASADIFSMPWNAFLKYNNGRFFANLEYCSQNTNRMYNYSNAVTAHAPVHGLDGPRYEENYRWMAEIGTVAGPGKLTVAAFYSSGQTLPGVNVTGATSTFNATKHYQIGTINYQVLQPYSFLMFPTYGGGNNIFNQDGTGQMGDAFALAARIDYAAAANLNLWGTYIHARRAEKHGYYAGSFNSNAGINYNISTAYPTNIVNATSPTLAANFKRQHGGGDMDPFVADDFIGWEAQAGVDWKLLENFTFGMGYSYWQLGPWFDQAYQAFNANSVNAFTGGGILVGRDPIQSVRASLTIDF